MHRRRESDHGATSMTGRVIPIARGGWLPQVGDRYRIGPAPGQPSAEGLGEWATILSRRGFGIIKVRTDAGRELHVKVTQLLRRNAVDETQ